MEISVSLMAYLVDWSHRVFWLLHDEYIDRMSVKSIPARAYVARKRELEDHFLFLADYMARQQERAKDDERGERLEVSVPGIVSTLDVSTPDG